MRSDCPFCHHQKASVYARNNALRSGGLRDVYICDDCRLLYPRPRMDRRESLEYMKDLYREYNNARPVDPLENRERRIHRRWEVSRGVLPNIAASMMKDIRPEGKALDIGTSTGRFCHILRSAGFEVYGLELCDDLARLARESGLNVHTGLFPDSMPHEFEDMRFSLISMMECMYYFIDLKEGLKKAYDMLEEGGYLLAKCHQGRSKYYRDKKVSFFERYGDGIQCMPSVESIRYCFERSGFEIVRMRGAMTRATAPVNFGRFIDRDGHFRKLFALAELFLNSIYEAAVLNVEDAERIIVLARKKKGKSDG